MRLVVLEIVRNETYFKRYYITNYTLVASLNRQFDQTPCTFYYFLMISITL